MKRLLVYILTILLGASIPIYFLLIWEPLNSKETFGDDITNVSKDNEINEDKNLLYEDQTLFLKQKQDKESLFNYLEGNRMDRLNLILKKLSIVDMVKVNEYFSNKNDENKIKQGIELVKKRLSSSDFEIFKDIIKDEVNTSFLQE